MTRITLDTDYNDDVKLTGVSDGPVRFRAADGHEASVEHELAVELVESRSDVTFSSGVPIHREDLRELASALPTDDVHGNMASDEIIGFLERFDDAELSVLKRNPDALTTERDGSDTVYAVEESDDGAGDGAEGE